MLSESYISEQEQ